MNKTLIKDALIITLDYNQPDYFYGDILVCEDTIEKITNHPEEIDKKRADQVIDGSNLMIMPGLVNTHGHAAMSILRGYADDLPLKKWLETKIWPIEAMLESDDVYWGAMLSIAEMIKGGTTTFTDMYYYMDRVAEASAESGIRAVLSRGMLGLDFDLEKEFEDTETLINDWHGAKNGRIKVMLGPHSAYVGGSDFLGRVYDLASETGLPIQVHLAETRDEVDGCRSEQGCSSTAMLSKIGILDFKVVAAHCVHLSDDDIDILADKKVGVSHNPGSNLKLGSGIAPIKRLLDRGIKVGLGTDGAASNNNLDMIEEMRLAALISKGATMDPTVVNAKTALLMAAPMGADILGLEETGILKPGYKADIIGLRRNRLHLTPLHDPLAHLVYASAAADVSLVMVDGRLLLEDGALKTLDEEKIRAEASHRAERLVNAGKDNK